MENRRICGIDFGVTHSCIAYAADKGKPFIIPNAEGEMMTPSAVYFESKDNTVVGQAAKEALYAQAPLCVTEIRRSMGNLSWEQEFYGSKYRPQDISSLILRKLAQDAETYIGANIEDVVIACPAYFGINEKSATRQAGNQAGLNVLAVVPEPVAAALAYGVSEDRDQAILVYDLTNATFDISVIESKSGEINILCTDGDHQFGGYDWDKAILSHLVNRFARETDIAQEVLLEDQETYAEIIEAAERCRKRLCYRKSAIEAIRFGNKKIIAELGQEEFLHITQQCLAYTLKLTERQLAFAQRQGINRIGKCLLTGEASQMPQITEALRRTFNLDIMRDTSRSVKAIGAALYGQRLFCNSADAQREYDVFLSYNSNDRALALQLAEVLEQKGTRVWLAEWELVPGRLWQEGLEDGIRNSRTAAVLIGPNGLGRWERREMQVCNNELVTRGMPVIPVLVPGASQEPELPLFLKELHQVDLRAGLTEAGIEKLLFGITGKNPRRKGENP
jgi:molecular chaperone DnaK (HSP70)